MADEDDVIVEEFEEAAPLIEEDPDLGPEELDDDFEELDDEDESFADDALTTDDAEAEDEAEPPSPRRRTSEDEDEDEDVVAPDDVEADLDTILKDRLVTAEESNEDEEDEAEADERGADSDRLQPKRADEQLCSRCFLIVRRNAPNCPVGDDACPLFS